MVIGYGVWLWVKGHPEAILNTKLYILNPNVPASAKSSTIVVDNSKAKSLKTISQSLDSSDVGEHLFPHLIYEFVVVDIAEYRLCFLFVSAGGCSEEVVVIFLAREVHLLADAALYALFMGECLKP